MCKIISDNRRCTVLDLGDKIIKSYDSFDSFEKEKRVYKKIGRKSYIPQLLDISENSIVIEKLNLPTLSKYVYDNKRIPYYLLNSLKKIRLELLENSFYDWGDFFKHEHIYIDDANYHINNFGVKIIDFDSYDYITENEIDSIRNDIVQEFEKLDSDKKEFNNKFGSFNKPVIDDFFRNKDELCYIE